MRVQYHVSHFHVAAFLKQCFILNTGHQILAVLEGQEIVDSQPSLNIVNACQTHLANGRHTLLRRLKLMF